MAQASPSGKRSSKRKSQASPSPRAPQTRRARRATALASAARAVVSDAHYAALLARLDDVYPGATTELRYASPLQLLVATILSAQCTDERVNRVTPELFARYPEASALAAAEPAALEALIHATGFFRNKAKAIRGAAAVIAAQHGGEVPRTLEALVALPGVARKTANLVLGTAYGIPSGIVVDTHVTRLAARLGLCAAETPERIEQELMARTPQPRWIRLGQQLILHGRHVCQARKPRCETCRLVGLCPTGPAAVR
jgi:endonuclease-3